MCVCVCVCLCVCHSLCYEDNKSKRKPKEPAMTSQLRLPAVDEGDEEEESDIDED